MARTKRSRRAYSAGEWGRNRVRVFPDSKTGLYQIEWRENGRRLTRSLKHRDWSRAKRQADEFAAGFAGPELNGKKDAEPEPLTLGTLFEIYGEEVTPTKGRRTRQRDRVTTRMFLRFFGRDRRPETLSQRDWDRFIQARRAGRAGRSGKPVGNRTIEWDLTFLMTVLNWAARSRDEHGRLLLDSNPLKGLRKPKEKNPNRVVLSEDEYRAMLGVSRQVGWRFHVALVLAHETGHRIGAIRGLRWVGGLPKARIAAGNSITTYRTARSALPAVGPERLPACVNSGKVAIEWRELAGISAALFRRIHAVVPPIRHRPHPRLRGNIPPGHPFAEECRGLEDRRGAGGPLGRPHRRPVRRDRLWSCQFSKSEVWPSVVVVH